MKILSQRSNMVQKMDNNMKNRIWILIPLIILMILSVLELGVAIIQAYIFSILTCIYLKDAFEGH